ncbi:polysaccharide deacetylase family protein [Colwellia sp. MB3u-70]|uniref:polysaccharide deacetylase family protein n=1 Tax=unclassified Colwellia TaxID=196834 RepID=UPI0015F5EBDD|nr:MULTISPECIES: polysaccharide deacetylase family protein [unclassified Colwellia]MBA6294080.1 polysaccharide deacetylase family protein [Colwellia sp. MB3u-8]MBA6307621.1 polysaccharide deacetylase family protein [Colwellia sp. MB3u-70]
MLHKLKYLLRSYVLPDRLFLLSKNQQEKNIYLTFDDGPVPNVIKKLLPLLDKYQIKVTFFVIGSRAEKNPNLMAEIHKRGHTIANHSYNHPAFNKISLAEKLMQIDKANKIISQTTERSCTLFRAPQGRWDMRLLFAMLQKKITAVHWSRDSMDFLKEPTNKIVERFLKQPVKSGDIILFHDDHERCIDALDILIPQWLAQGYSFNALENKH